MRILIFWDSITEWYYDLEQWGWVNRLKMEFWKQGRGVEAANLWISGDEIPDILKRFEVEVKAFTEKYNEEMKIVFAVWINDSVVMWDWKNIYSIDEFKVNLEKLSALAGKYTSDISFLWLTRINESQVSPFPWSSTWKCYFNDRIKKFDEVIRIFALDNSFWYLDLFDCLGGEDLSDGLHPNARGHGKIYEKVKEWREF